MSEFDEWAVAELFDAYWDGRDDEPSGYAPYSPSFKTCKYCGRENLVWGIADEKWRLHNTDGSLHTCKEYKKEVK